MYPEIPISFTAQIQDEQPGLEYIMEPRPVFDNSDYIGGGKLKDKVAIITGGDSGIGRAIAVAFAKEGARVMIAYLDEDTDAQETQDYIKNIINGECELFSGDLTFPPVARDLVQKTVDKFGTINILVNNHAVQCPQDSIHDIDKRQLVQTFAVNVFSYFYLTEAALHHLECGDCIINTSSITAYAGSACLLDYSATKGAIDTFTKSLALNLVHKGIRVNAVAPGPIWTPLIVSSFKDEDTIEKFGQYTPMQRAGQPFECAPAYVYLASDDSKYVTGQIIHVNGGQIVGG